MKADEIKRILDLCRSAGVAAVEVGPDSFKAQFFPPMPAEMKYVPPEEPREPSASKTPDPDTTLLALQAQSGR